MNELESMLRGVAENNLDKNQRLIFADYADEHFPATPVKTDELPKGFNAWWHASGLSIRFREERSNYGRWAGWEIIQAFDWIGHLPEIGFDWFDHGGASDIAGYPTVVGEPYQSDDLSVAAAAALQNVFRCPVTFSRNANHNHGCVRIVVWFTFSDLFKEQ